MDEALLNRALSDNELYKRFISGDTAAFEALVLSHKDNLIYFLQRYVHDVHTCEDMAQEAFAAIFVYKDRYDDTKNFKTYLYAIARNKAMDHIRKVSRLELLSDEDGANDEDELFNRVVKNDEQIMVHKAIRKLSLDYQRLILLIDIEGMSYKDVGSILNKTLPQVKVSLFRARKALKNLLVKEGYTYEE